MSTNSRFNKLILDLSSGRDILQSLAFERLMNDLWSAKPLNPSRSVFLCNDLACIDVLIESIGGLTPALQNKIAWLLGALVDAESGTLELDKRRKIRAGIPEYLSIVENILRSDHSVGDAKEIHGFIFLLGHFPEDASLIGGRLSDYLGQDAYQATNLGLVFSLLEDHPVRSQFLLAYQGAMACNQVCDARTSVFKDVLACPECRGKLDYSADIICCQKCQSSYEWCSDTPNLIPKDCVDPEEYPESLVKIYGAETRPRFVRVMGQDWLSLITHDREQGYLNQFLRPVDGPILDLACGIGNSTQLLIDIFGRARVIAVDYSTAMIQHCERNIKGSTLARGSSSALPIANESLGAVNCSDALQALPDPQQAILEVARCMRPGASFTGFTFLEASWPYSYFQHRLHFAKRHLFTLDGIRGFLESSKLEIVDLMVIEQAIFFTAKKPLK